MKKADGSAQEELDELARANSWQVSSRPGKSVYVRGAVDALILLFDEEGSAYSMTRTRPLAAAVDRDWKGRIGNILRSRWRTHENAPEGAGG